MFWHAFTVHFAYLDPGTGSVVVQAIIGAIAGVSVFGRRVIGTGLRKLKAVLSRKSAVSDGVDKKTNQKSKTPDRS